MTTAEAKRVEALLAELNLEEKAALCGGSSTWYGTGVPRLGIPPLKVTDGPIGARGGNLGGGLSAACFPNGSALAATFDPERVEEVGVALGQEARTKQCHVLLGPTVNMHRSPLGGRHFECYSEDPLLAARIAAGFVRGVQSQGIGTSVKHFAANDSEFERHTIDSVLDERTLREITLPPFEAAVREAGAWTVMAAYNGLNGTTCSANRELLEGILKDEWGFDGLVVSDWFGTKDTVGAALGGLELEMPGPARFFGAPLAEAVERGEVPGEILDDKARRILRIMARCGVLDETGPEREEQAVDLPEHRALARRVASDAAVLLRNEGDALPLDRERLTRIAVIGPNAKPTCIQGGGSARVVPHYETHVLDSLRETLGEDVEVVHARGCTSHKALPTFDASAVDPGSDGDARGLKTSFFASLDHSGGAVLTRRTRRPDLIWIGSFHPDIDPRAFSLRLEGRYTPEETGLHSFALTSGGKARLFVDDTLLVDNWDAQVRGDSFFGTGSAEATGTVSLVAGEPVALRIDYTSEGAIGIAGLRIGHLPPLPADMPGEAERVAREADAAVVVVGLNADWETEGHDKDDMRLPGDQDALVTRVAAANPNTIVVVNAGAPLEMPWADDVRAILWAWYGGQEAGRAIADVLLGDAEPAGRLPTTFPERLADVPCHAAGEPEVYPGKDGRVVYAEGIFSGYRHYDAHDVTPRYPFGHGLSYGRIRYLDLALESAAIAPGDDVVARVGLRNEGERPGVTVVQAYVHDEEASVPRPPQELAAFAKVALAPGEQKTLTLRIPARGLAFWDTSAHAFRVEPGRFELRVGASSRDIRQRASFRVHPD